MTGTTTNIAEGTTYHPLCPVKKKPKRIVDDDDDFLEPPNEEVDHVVKSFTKMAGHLAKVEIKDNEDPHDKILGSTIPATGRGNSDQGEEWLNPSANQLYRALKRNDKAIDYSDAMPVAQVHAIVTEETWRQILDYEALHWKTCKEPKLARFEGLDGCYTFKAKFNHHILGNPWPYDRHDWWVDRCGKEIRYIIDYHATPTGQKDDEGDDVFDYTIDTRPAPTLTGLWDRLRLSIWRWRHGQSSW